MLATNPEEPPEERQRRELEEIRRKFYEVGARLGSAFEPATPATPIEQDGPRALPPPAAPLAPDRPARPRWQWLAAAALIFVLGSGLGYLLPRSGGAPPPPPSPQPSATTVAPLAASPPPQPVVPRSCLETARRGDEVIALLNRNIRTRRLAEVLKAYTLASQACRKEASP